MTENKTPAADTTPVKAEAPKADETKSVETAPVKDEATIAAEKAKAFAALPPSFQEAITKINVSIDEHNAKVDALKKSEAKDVTLIKADIFEQSDNKIVKRMYDEYLKLIEQAEKIKTAAYAEIDKHGLMPKDLSEAEVEKLKGEVTTSTKDLKSQLDAFETFETMMPGLSLVPHVNEIKTRRGIAKSTSSSEGVKRPRFKRIEINGITQDDKGNKVFGVVSGEEKYTFTFAAKYLGKQHKGISWTSGDLQDAYYKGLDADNLPDTHTFEMPFTYKDANGNDQTVKYTIKTIR